MTEHDGGIRAQFGCDARADVLRFLHRQIHDIAAVKHALPPCEQVVEPDADRDAAIDAWNTHNRLDDLAAMRIGTVGAGQYHKLRSINRRGACQLCVDQLA